MTVGEERRRLAEAARGDKAWRQFGPYMAERQGVANPEGNHGEDVKECYYYLDATPTVS
jgi:hypothetical protein